MNSPYFQGNVGSGWGPPAGISAMQALDRQTAMAGPQALGDAVEAFGKQFKQQQDEGKAADYLFKAHPEYLEQLGIHPEQFKTMGSMDKSRAAGAVMRDQAMKDMMAKRADTESQTKERNSIADWRTAQAGRINDEDSASQAMMEHLAGMGRPTPAQVNPAMVQDMMSSVTPTNTAPVLPGAPAQARWSPEVQAILESGASMGRSNPRVASTILKEVLPQVMGEGSAKRSQFFDKGTVAEDVPGMPGYKRVVTGPNSSTVQYMGEDVGVPVPQHDEAGSLIGYSMRDAKGHSTFTKFKGDSQIKVATDEQGNAITGYYRMGDKVIDTRTAIQKLAGGSAAAPAASAKALPLPGSKAELKKDQVYTTAKGPAKWDGAQFVPVGQ